MITFLGNCIFLSLASCFTQDILILFLFFYFFFFFSRFPIYYDLFSWSGNLDSLSFFLIFLTIWILYVIVSSRARVYKNKNSLELFNVIIVLLLLSLYWVFMVNRTLLFYFFFEFSLIPTALLIMGWGYQVERFQAFIYFLIYTMFSSLPLLILILLFKSSILLEGFFDFYFCFIKINTRSALSFILFWGLFGAFMVKFPIYLFHLWLPKAHVEAPVSGSIILAGVLLKMGGYGIIRLRSIFSLLIIKFSFFFIRVSIWGIIYIGLNCLRSNDIKSLIAYSSVSHMAVCLVGLLTLYIWGWFGGVYILLGHGVCSSGLFRYINFLYERTASRSFYLNKSLLIISKFLVVLAFLLRVFNIAAPPSINLFREINLICSLLSYERYLIIFILLGSFFVACYRIYFFYSTQMGKLYRFLVSFTQININEYHNLTLLKGYQ